MTVTQVAVLVVALMVVGVYVSWTAGRLDRLHARVDAAAAALDAQLVRRAAAARAVVPLLPPEPAAELDRAVHDALEATDGAREAVENDLSRALRLALPLVPDGPELEELRTASTRVGLARSIHNSAVKDTRSVRLRRIPRALRLAGHRRLPDYFEIDDTTLGPA